MKAEMKMINLGDVYGSIKALEAMEDDVLLRVMMALHEAQQAMETIGTAGMKIMLSRAAKQHKGKHGPGCLCAEDDPKDTKPDETMH